MKAFKSVFTRLVGLTLTLAMTVGCGANHGSNSSIEKNPDPDSAPTRDLTGNWKLDGLVCLNSAESTSKSFPLSPSSHFEIFKINKNELIFESTGNGGLGFPNCTSSFKNSLTLTEEENNVTILSLSGGKVSIIGSPNYCDSYINFHDPDKKLQPSSMYYEADTNTDANPIVITSIITDVAIYAFSNFKVVDEESTVCLLRYGKVD